MSIDTVGLPDKLVTDWCRLGDVDPATGTTYMKMTAGNAQPGGPTEYTLSTESSTDALYPSSLVLSVLPPAPQSGSVPLAIRPNGTVDIPVQLRAVGPLPTQVVTPGAPVFVDLPGPGGTRNGYVPLPPAGDILPGSEYDVNLIGNLSTMGSVAFAPGDVVTVQILAGNGTPASAWAASFFPGIDVVPPGGMQAIAVCLRGRVIAAQNGPFRVQVSYVGSEGVGDIRLNVTLFDFTRLS